MNVVTEITPGDFGAFVVYVSRKSSSVGSSLLLLGVAAVVGIVIADLMPLFGSALHIPTFPVAILGFGSLSLSLRGCEGADCCQCQVV